jgi:hypothetical protein
VYEWVDAIVALIDLPPMGAAVRPGGPGADVSAADAGPTGDYTAAAAAAAAAAGGSFPPLLIDSYSWGGPCGLTGKLGVIGVGAGGLQAPAMPAPVALSTQAGQLLELMLKRAQSGGADGILSLSFSHYDSHRRELMTACVDTATADLAPLEMRHKFYVDFLHPQIAVVSPASCVLMSSDRARFDRLVGSLRRETHIIVDSFTATAGAAPPRNVRPWDWRALRRVVAPSPVKITIVSAPPEAGKALAGTSVPSVVTVQLPDLHARCQSTAFFAILDVFNTVVLAPRPPHTDIASVAGALTGAPGAWHGVLFSEQIPDEVLDTANAWLLRARLAADEAGQLSDEIASLYGPGTSVRLVFHSRIFS